MLKSPRLWDAVLMLLISLAEEKDEMIVGMSNGIAALGGGTGFLLRECLYMLHVLYKMFTVHLHLYAVAVNSSLISSSAA